MYTATTMLGNAVRGNVILPDSNRLYYRNVYLQSEHWKSIRKEKLAKVHHCEKCKSKYSLDVHHLDYKGLYDVKLDDLQVLCRLCHDKEHKKKDKKANKKYTDLIRKEKRIKDKIEDEYKEICDDFDYILNRKNPNMQLIFWLLKSIISLKNAPYFSPKNKERHEKFNKTVNYKQKYMNTYVSIHY